MDKISIIIPCYNEEQALPLFYQEITKLALKMNGQAFELVFVNDGSQDATLSVLKSLAEKDARIKYISFSRNFGKEAAMFAGFEHATGDYAVVMDADLQDPPHMLEEMYQTLITSDYDCVATRRVTRKGEPVIRSFFARMFYRIINKMSKTEIVDGARDYRMMTRKMLDSILSVKEYSRFSKGIFSWVGFNTKWLEYENINRVAGETKWSFWGLFFYSLDGIIAFSSVPLAFSSIMGFILFIISILMIVFIIVRTLLFGDPTSGWPSLVCIICLVSGIQLFSIGVLGQYLSKIYLEVKNRPLYIIKEDNCSDTIG